LAYIGSDKAVADLPFGFKGGNVAAGGQLTYYFWRSAYLSKLFSLRNRTLGMDLLTRDGGADGSCVGLDQGQGFREGYFSCLGRGHALAVSEEGLRIYADYCSYWKSLINIQHPNNSLLDRACLMS
jgi:hypothetical protein